MINFDKILLLECDSECWSVWEISNKHYKLENYQITEEEKEKMRKTFIYYDSSYSTSVFYLSDKNALIKASKYYIGDDSETEGIILYEDNDIITYFQMSKSSTTIKEFEKSYLTDDSLKIDYTLLNLKILDDL